MNTLSLQMARRKGAGHNVSVSGRYFAGEPADFERAGGAADFVVLTARHPPAPKTVDFPATRFLDGLVPDDVTPSKTPWWLLLLRLLIAALVIFALAQPIYNPRNPSAGRKISAL